MFIALGYKFRFAAVFTALRALALTSIIVLAIVAVNLAMPFAIAALAVAAAAIVAGAVAVVAFAVALCVMVAHAALFAVTVALWAGVALAVVRIVVEASRIDWRMVEA